MLETHSIEPIDTTPKGIAECVQLLRVVFPETDRFTEEYLNWQYNLNPIGQAVGFNAWSRGQLAAHYVTLPIISLIQGRQTKGLLSLNTATHPKHRGKKLFTRLAEATYQRGKELGYEFVAGVANANSTPGFIGKLGFTLVSPLQVKLGLGKIKQTNTNENYVYQQMWSRELLHWRLQNPSQKYTIKTTEDKFTVEVTTGQYGIRAIIGVFDKNLLTDIKSVKSNTLNPLKLWMGIDSSIDWRGSFYFTLPNKLRQAPLNLIFRGLREDIEFNCADVKFQCIDFDAY